METRIGVDPEIDRLTEKTFTTKVTKKLKATASLVQDLLSKNDFPFEIRTVKDADGEYVVWDEGPEAKRGVTREHGRRLLMSYPCKCGSRASWQIHAEKRSEPWGGCEYANVYTCRKPTFGATAVEQPKKDPATGLTISPDRPCDDPDAAVWDLIREGFAVEVHELPAPYSEK